jgi:hypothetical protein
MTTLDLRLPSLRKSLHTTPQVAEHYSGDGGNSSARASVCGPKYPQWHQASISTARPATAYASRAPRPNCALLLISPHAQNTPMTWPGVTEPFRTRAEPKALDDQRKEHELSSPGGDTPNRGACVCGVACAVEEVEETGGGIGLGDEDFDGGDGGVGSYCSGAGEEVAFGAVARHGEGLGDDLEEHEGGNGGEDK